MLLTQISVHYFSLFQFQSSVAANGSVGLESFGSLLQALEKFTKKVKTNCDEPDDNQTSQIYEYEKQYLE